MRGAERLAELVGKHICQTVVAQDRQRFAQFVGDVCAGRTGSLQYDLLPLVGAAIPVETQAVPLQRDDTAPAVGS